MNRKYRIIPLKYPIIGIIVLGLLLFSGSIYRNIIKTNKNLFPGFIRNWIEEREQRVVESPIVYKDEQSLRIIEGWTNQDIANYLNQELGTTTDLIDLVGENKTSKTQALEGANITDYRERFSFLDSLPSGNSLEGFLFPDSYRVFSDATSTDLLVEKMLTNFDKKLSNELREEIARQGRSLYEIIIMASIVEKEAPIDYQDPDNRNARLVAGIFWRRLKIGMALQSDATLSYWFRDNKPAHDAQELEQDNLYNSYLYRGLPPTPICNPGLKAIEAAIYPLESDYTYFLTDYNGENIYFAKTYDEHLNNKYLYLSNK